MPAFGVWGVRGAAECVADGLPELPLARPQTCLSHICVKGGSDWGEVWQVGTDAGAKYMKAWEHWISSPPAVVPCPSTLTYDWPH